MNVNFSFEAIKCNIIKFERFISMFNSFNNSFKQKNKSTGCAKYTDTYWISK